MNSNELKLTDRIREAVLRLGEAANEAASRVRAGADNPHIQRVGAGMVVSSADAFKPLGLSPFTHDWLAQYRMAADLLERRRFAPLRSLLEGCRHDDPTHGRVAFAPEVIERIRAIVGDLVVDEALVDGALSLASTSAAAPRRAHRP